MAAGRGCRVFVDANIWISWGYQLSKAEATTLADLVEHELVRVVVTDLTVIEIAKRFRDIDFEKLEPLTKADIRGLAKQLLGVDIPVVDREELRTSLFNGHLDAVRLRLRNRFNAEVRSIDTVKPSQVLTHYTNGTGLFGPAGKKNQFPDAFIFSAIAGDLSERNPLIVLSQDGDFANACEKTPHIQRITSMAALLKELAIEPEGAAMIALVVAAPNQFELALTEMLQDYGVEATDVEDAEIEVLDVQRVSDLQLTGLYRISEEDSKYIGFGTCSLEASITFTHPDWDTATWDSEDRVPIPHRSIDGEMDADIDNIKFSFLVDITNGVVGSVSNCEARGPRGITTQLLSHWDY